MKSLSLTSFTFLLLLLLLLPFAFFLLLFPLSLIFFILSTISLFSFNFFRVRRIRISCVFWFKKITFSFCIVKCKKEWVCFSTPFDRSSFSSFFLTSYSLLNYFLVKRNVCFLPERTRKKIRKKNPNSFSFSFLSFCQLPTLFETTTSNNKNKNAVFVFVLLVKALFHFRKK